MFDNLPLQSLNDLIPFTLVLARIGGLFAAMPTFGGKVVPNRVKTPLILAMGLVIFPIIKTHGIVGGTDSISITLLTFREVLVGLTLGLLSQVIFTAIEFCGQQIGMQMGLTMASMFDPTSQAQVPTMAVFQGALATLVYLSLDVHHFFIRAMVESYQVLPIGAWHTSPGLLKFIIESTAGVFVLALKLAAPVAVALLATSVALGIVARSFPAMNVFMVSMPLNIGIGFLILGLSLPVFVRVLAGTFGNLVVQMKVLFKLLA